MPRPGYGKKDGIKKGMLQNGMSRNRTDKCRHPELKKRRY